jgi:hypothetical protein
MREVNNNKVMYPTISSQLSIAYPSKEKVKPVKPSEYNELIDLLARKKRIIEEIRYECQNKEVVPTIRLKRILAESSSE